MCPGRWRRRRRGPETEAAGEDGADGEHEERDPESGAGPGGEGQAQHYQTDQAREGTTGEARLELHTCTLHTAH